MPAATPARGRTAESHVHTFENGLTLIVEPMPAVRSAAMALMTPGGCIYEPTGVNGTAAVLADVITRGAGDYNSRQLSDAFDNLGAQRSELSGWSHCTFRSAASAEAMPEILRLYADVVRRPHLSGDEIAPAVDGLRQSLLSLRDEPQRLVGVELRKLIFEAPWGRPTDGSLEDLTRVNAGTVGRHFRGCLGPTDAVLAVAGAVDVDEVRPLVAELLGDWQPQSLPVVQRGPRGGRRVHIQEDSAQTQIAVAHDASPYRDDGYYAAWALSSVLGGSSSSRLFTEVREKRGLCYSIYASLSSTPTEGRLITMAGTTADRAQETLDLTLAELLRVTDDLSEEELERVKAQAKSSLVMQQDSTSARAGALARDWVSLGRVRPIREVRASIEALRVDDLRDEWHRRGTAGLTLLTVGPSPLDADEPLFT